ncbi:MAG: 2OG-Fe(II) oxygenase [Emcibacter sp.]|nr:2OG-Fe(II) oxygenase [Emcibacter sp.]
MTQDLHRQDLEKFLTKKKLNDHWKKWVRTNIKAGCDKNGMFKIMVDEGFEYDLIKDALNFEPIIPVDQIINPLKRPKVKKNEKTSPPFIPNAKRLDHVEVELYILDDFLNKTECEALIANIETALKPSILMTNDESEQSNNKRKSCDMGLIGNDNVRDLDRRISSILGLSAAHSDSLQGQYYTEGQECKDQTDFLKENELKESGTGQRSYSFLIYLNDVEDGGEISFPKINRSILPKMGRAVIWNNLHKDGTVNDHCIYHEGLVKKGSKTVIKKYFRTQNGLPVFKRLEKENVPNYTKIGFEKDTLPKPLFKKIVNFYRENFKHQVKETVAERFIKNEEPNVTKSSLIQLPDSIQKEIQNCLKPVLEIWSGLKLDPTFVYGIRVYHNGTALKVHRDRNGTHIIGVIINVDQELNEAWPLRIEDNYYRQHDILLKPGEVVYYEAVRLAHGRPIPFNGELFANIFCHFKISETGK